MINCLVEIIFFCVSLIMPTSENCEPKIGTNFNNTRKQLTNSSVVSDIYEDNDEISEAYRIDEENYYNLSNRDISLNATLHYEPLVSDVDFYSFTLVKDSTVNINLTTNSFLPFVFNVYETVFNMPSSDLTHYPSIIYSDSSSSTSKSYSSSLDIGVYYLEIKYLNEVPQNTTMEYELTIHISNTFFIKDFDVDLCDLVYNKNIIGAVWVNDLFPINNINIFDYNKNYIFETYNVTNLITPLHYLDDIAEYYEDSTFKVAQIYVWNPQCKAFLYELLTYLIDNVIDEITEDELKKTKIEIYFEVIDSFIKIAGKVASLIVPSILVELGEAIINIIVEQFENYVLTLNMPYTTLEIASYLSFLSALKNSLFVQGINDANNTAFNERQALNNIFTIPIYGSINYSYDSFGKKTSYLSLKPTFMNFNNSQYSFTLNDISTIQTTNLFEPFSNGRAMAYESTYNYDINLLTPVDSNLISYKEPVYQMIYLDTGYPMLINKGNYFRFKFVVPETKRYFFKAYGIDSDNIMISLFTNINYGYEADNLIVTKTGGYQHLINFHLKGCMFSYDLTKDQEIFIKVYGNNYSQIENLIDLEINDEFPSELAHVHDYNLNYQYINGTQHRAYCECGSSKIEGHYISQNSLLAGGEMFCLKCGGEADLGFVIPQTNSIIISNAIGETNNKSYILANRIILLNQRDFNAMINNDLKFVYYTNKLITIS